jgi:hypothetical protein
MLNETRIVLTVLDNKQKLRLKIIDFEAENNTH